jgi:integrase
LNGRPQSELDNIFLSAKAPMRAVTTGSLRGQYNAHRAEAGLNRSPFHALRRAVGTNMATSDVPITTIAQILGHSDIDSTRKYIALDTKHLKECTLNLVGIEPKSTKARVV